MRKKLYFLIFLSFIALRLYCDTFSCYKSAGIIINGRKQNNNNSFATYVYIAFSNDRSSCYEVDENGNTFSLNFGSPNLLAPPDLRDSPHLLGYNTYFYKNTTDEGYLVYESQPSYYYGQLVTPAQTLIFNKDYSRLNHQHYQIVHDYDYNFDYTKQIFTSIYELSKSPKKEKKKTPFY